VVQEEIQDESGSHDQQHPVVVNMDEVLNVKAEAKKMIKEEQTPMAFD